jgi:hypothetical protein
MFETKSIKGKERFLWLIAIVWSTFVAGCAVAPPSVSPPTKIVKAPLSNPVTVSPYSTSPHEIRRIKKTPIPLPDNDVHAIVNDTKISQLTIDNDYLYWTRHDDNKLYRIPLQGGEKEVLAVSDYDHGQFSVTLISDRPFVRTGQWLVVVDTPTGKEAGWTWKVRAFNLETHSEHVLLRAERDTESWPGPEIQGDENGRIVVTYNHSSEQENCAENVLAVIDLDTEDISILDKGCTEGRYRWVFAGISGPYVVADRYLPEEDGKTYKGATSDIFLFNLNTQEVTQLTHNGRSSMPDISGHWVAWKSSPRFDFGETIIYNIDTDNRYLVDIPDIPGVHGYRAPRLSSERWLYWRSTKSGEPVFVFDLENQLLVEVVPASDTQAIRNRVIFEDIMTWERMPLHTISESVIEWRELPSLPEGLR